MKLNEIDFEEGETEEKIQGGFSQEMIKELAKKELKEAELERDRREVNYIMKKMACESREDNDWRFINKYGNKKYIIYLAKFLDGKTHNRMDFNIIKSYCTYFNQAYFNTEKDAQKCLDFLLEKYGKERLKEIWGII
jgi:hypothetical protein